MELTPLRYFAATARHLNYTRAAEELFLSRQALRQSIQTLEKELGTPLFGIEKNHLHLTPAGEFLLQKAEELLATADQTEFELRSLSRQFDEISAAYSYSILTFLFPALQKIMSGFDNPSHNLNLHAQAASNDDIWAMLSDGRIRFGVMMCMPWDTPDYTFVSLQRFALGLCFSETHPLAGKDVLSLADLAGEPLMGMGDFSANYHRIAEDLKAAGLTCHFESVPDAIDAFYHVRHSGKLLLDLADHPEAVFPGMRVVPLADYTFDLCLVHRADLTPTASEAFFFHYLQQHLRENPIRPS